MGERESDFQRMARITRESANGPIGYGSGSRDEGPSIADLERRVFNVEVALNEIRPLLGQIARELQALSTLVETLRAKQTDTLV